jgi:hypothetical protein
VYGEGVITNWAVRNWFSKFCSRDVTWKDEPRGLHHPSDFDDEIFKSILENNERVSRKA